MAARVWLAAEEDVPSVAEAHAAAFATTWASTRPTDEGMRATVEALVRDAATEFLLGAAADGERPAGVCQLRYRLTVWTGAVRLLARGPLRGGRRAPCRAWGARSRRRPSSVPRDAWCRRIDLDVNEDNLSALALYRDMGFSTEPKGAARTLYAMRRL